MKYLALIYVLFLLSPNESSAQNPCGSTEAHAALLHSNPELQQVEALQNELIRSLTLNLGPQRTGSGVYTIPVVVHVVHKEGTIYGTAENLTDDRVRAGIQQMNDAFRNVGVFNPTTGVDVEIEFCLASQTPEGDFTTGIVHVPKNDFTNLGYYHVGTQMLDSEMEPWDPYRYCNIWVVDDIAGVLGFAFYPPVHGRVIDGIFLEAQVFFEENGYYSLAAHLLGHYLWLLHTYEGSCYNEDCTRHGDMVCDTPPDSHFDFGGCSPVNSCYTDLQDTSAANPFLLLGEQNDMVENYMAYSSYTCPDRFTQGQKDRMRNTLTTARVSLLGSTGCEYPTVPAVYFETPEVSVTESSYWKDGRRGYQDLEIPVLISAPPTGDATISFSFGGNAEGDGEDYSILGTPELVFRDGLMDEQILTIRIWDTPEAESLERIEIAYSISGNTNAEPAVFNQTFTAHIQGNSIGVINVYPNPFRNWFYLELYAPYQSPYLIEVFDASGRLVSREEEYTEKGENIFRLAPLVGRTSGIYYLKVTQGEHYATWKLFKR